MMKRAQDSVTNGVKPPQGQGVQRRGAVGPVLGRGAGLWQGYVTLSEAIFAQA